MNKFNQDNIKPGDKIETQDGSLETVSQTGKYVFTVENDEKIKHHFYTAIVDKKPKHHFYTAIVDKK